MNLVRVADVGFGSPIFGFGSDLVEKLEQWNSDSWLPFWRYRKSGTLMDPKFGPKTKEKLNSEIGSISGYLRFVSQVLYKSKLGRILGEISRTRPFIICASLIMCQSIPVMCLWLVGFCRSWMRENSENSAYLYNIK